MLGGQSHKRNIADRVGAGEAIAAGWPGADAGQSPKLLDAFASGGRLWWVASVLAIVAGVGAWSLGAGSTVAVLLLISIGTLPDLWKSFSRVNGFFSKRRKRWLHASQVARVEPFAVAIDARNERQQPVGQVEQTEPRRTLDARIAFRAALPKNQRAALSERWYLNDWKFTLLFIVVAWILLAKEPPGLGNMVVVGLLIGGIVISGTLVNNSSSIRQSMLCDSRQREGCCPACGTWLLDDVKGEPIAQRITTISRCQRCNMEWPLVPPAMPEEVAAMLERP